MIIGFDIFVKSEAGASAKLKRPDKNIQKRVPRYFFSANNRMKKGGVLSPPFENLGENDLRSGGLFIKSTDVDNAVNLG